MDRRREAKKSYAEGNEISLRAKIVTD